MVFDNREEAGDRLAEEVKKLNLKPDETVILAIPRGGVPVAYRISKKTGIPFSLVIVKKLAPPYNPEAAVGAIAPDENYIVDKSLITAIPEDIFEKMKAEAMEEIKKRLEKYLNNRIPDVKDKSVIIVDDGIATGYTALVAGKYAKNLGAKEIILAVPVCPYDSIPRVKEIFDKVICLHRASDMFFAVGAYYRDFHQLSDEEMFSYLKKAENEGLLYENLREVRNEKI